MLRTILLAFLLAIGLKSTAHAAAHGPLGLGIVLIDPTGISANYYYDKQKSLSLGLGFGDNYLHLNVDHLWYRNDIIIVDRTPIDLYLGLGARFYQHDYKHDDVCGFQSALPIFSAKFRSNSSVNWPRL
jgi:hypothetical protein